MNDEMKKLTQLAAQIDEEWEKKIAGHFEKLTETLEALQRATKGLVQVIGEMSDLISDMEYPEVEDDEID